MAFQLSVIVNVGVPYLNHIVVEHLFQQQIVSASRPVALGLDADHHIALPHGVSGFPPLEGLFLQVKAHLRRGDDEQTAVGAVIVAVAAVAAAHLRRRQLGVGHIGRQHGHGGDAAAVGDDPVRAVHGGGVILLEIELGFRVALVPNVGIEQVRGSHRGGLRRGAQRNGAVVDLGGVFFPRLCDLLPAKGGGQVFPGGVVPDVGAALEKDDMIAQT